MIPFYKKLLLGAGLLAGTLSAGAQVSVTATSGTTGPTAYTTLKAAFDAVNAGTHAGAVTIAISGNTTEAATAVLNAPATYSSISINATAAATVSGSIAGPLINLNGAKNVTINGGTLLTLVNSSTTGQVIRYGNDASNNVVRFTNIRGNFATTTSSAPASGVVLFDIGTTTGNDNNSIDSCDISGNNTAVCLIYSKGSASTTSSAGYNSGNKLRGNTLHDNINGTNTSSIGIYLAGSNTDWTISGNSLYHSTAVSSPVQFVVRGILVVPSLITDFHTITGNFVGGNAANAAGTMSLSASGTNALGFIGLDVETGGPGNLVQNNTVKNVTLTYGTPAGSFSNAAIFGFIGGYNGTTTITGNTISNLNFSNTAGFLSFQALHVNARVTGTGTITPTFTITNNTITQVTCNSGGSSGDVNMYGIRLETSSTAGLLNTSTSRPSFVCTGNTLTNITQAFTGITSSFIRVIATVTSQGDATTTALLYPKVNISNNNINTITSASFSGASALIANVQFSSGSVTAIHYAGSTGGTGNTADTARIQENTIYNLMATNTQDTARSIVIGILATTGVHDISRNRIYDLKNSAPGTNATYQSGIVGITVRSAIGASTVANNMISLGTGQTGNLSIFGILQNFSATGPVNVYHNSVVVTGAGAAGNTRPTAAFYRGDPSNSSATTTPVNVKNNIFYNTRTGGGNQFAIANLNTTAPVNFTSDNNDLYSANAATVALWGTASNTIAAYKTNSGDLTSGSFTVSFTDIATADLHLTGTSLTDANLFGSPLPAVTVDFDNQARNANFPVKGADEVAITCAAPTFTTQPTAQTVCAGSSVTFTAASSATGVTYQYLLNGTAITGATNATYTINSAQTSDAGNYSVRISTGCGSTTSTPVALTVNTGGTCGGTAVSNISEEVSASVLMPNIVRNNATLRVNVRRAMNVSWSISDAQGRVVKRFNQSVSGGQNDLSLSLQDLGAGTYQLTGYPTRGGKITLRFVKL
jgi:hypothetical protein